MSLDGSLAGQLDVPQRSFPQSIFLPDSSPAQLPDHCAPPPQSPHVTFYHRQTLREQPPAIMAGASSGMPPTSLSSIQRALIRGVVTSVAMAAMA